MGTETDARTCARAAIDPLGVGCSTKSGSSRSSFRIMRIAVATSPRLVRVEPQRRVADHRADGRGRLEVVSLSEADLQVDHARADRHGVPSIGCELVDRGALQEVEVADSRPLRPAQEYTGSPRLPPDEIPQRRDAFQRDFKAWGANNPRFANPSFGERPTRCLPRRRMTCASARASGAVVHSPIPQRPSSSSIWTRLTTKCSATPCAHTEPGRAPLR
jgi:hypothetical protein